MSILTEIKDRIVVYTDGSIRMNLNKVRKGGAGIIIAKGGDIRYFRVPVLGLPSSYIELEAITYALKILYSNGYEDNHITITTDFLPIKDGAHGRIRHWEKTKGNFKMKYFWLKFQEIYQKFSNLTIRWISRNDKDSFNEMADALASEAMEIPTPNEGEDITFEEVIEEYLPSEDKKHILVLGDKFYGDYSTIKEALEDNLSHYEKDDVVLWTLNQAGAQGFAEYYSSKENILLNRILIGRNTNEKEAIRQILKLSFFDEILHFGRVNCNSPRAKNYLYKKVD